MYPKKPKTKRLMERHDFLFLAGFGGAFFLTLIIFSLFGLVPKEISAPSIDGLGTGVSLESQSNDSLFGVDFTKGTAKVQKVRVISSDDLPTRIVISKIGLDSKIVNPENSGVSFLDNQLSIAPVRYPGSGTISSGNIFVFGHSTGFKIVQNQAYKVFNNIKNLKEGDQITIYSLSGKSFAYNVVGVKEASKNETWVNFSSKSPSLTLSTCDSFGTASDRYVVTAVKAQ